MPKIDSNITIAILAGGKGSRLGGVDKGLLELHATPLIEHLINRIKQQNPNIIISANRNLERYRQFGFPVYSDDIDDYAGPLAGILKALKNCPTEWLMTLPADSPFIPSDLTIRLASKIEAHKIVMAHDGKRLQPTFSLIHQSLITSLEQFLQQGERKAQRWMQQQPHTIVDFSDKANAFININTEAELADAELHFSEFMA